MTDLYVRIYPNPDQHSVNPYRVDLMDGEKKLVMRTAPDYLSAWLMARVILYSKRREIRKANRVRTYKEKIIR